MCGQLSLRCWYDKVSQFLSTSSLEYDNEAVWDVICVNSEYLGNSEAQLHELLALTCC